MTTPPDPTSEIPAVVPPAPLTPAVPTEDDARRFFRELYAPQANIPRGRVKKDVQGFETKYGKTTGLTSDRLSKIAKEVRKQLRDERGERPEAGDDADESDVTAQGKSADLDKWLIRIGVGVYILAAIALFYHAIAIAKIGFTWPELRTYVVGLFGSGGVLWLLSFGVKQLKDAKLPSAVKTTFLILISSVFTVVILAFAVWVVVLILRDAGVLPPVSLEKGVLVGPPKEFSFDKTGSYADEATLPIELFGKATDENARPRDWLEEIQFGTAGKLGAGQLAPVKEDDVRHSWLITKDQQTGKGFEKGIHEFKVHVNVGTAEDVVILGFLVQPGGHMKVVPLTREYNASKFEYTFVVPQSRAGDRLLFYVGMAKSAYTKFEKENQRFLLHP
jgi:hypothetical protein